jgi:hypothetical protein
MRRLFTVTAILVLLAPAVGCESCLTRGAKAQPYPTCVPTCEPGCAPSVAPGGSPLGGCSSCAPTVGVMETMPGPAT